MGMRGAHVIRVLIADEIARIVGDLEKLAPYGDVIDVCGVAHQASAVIEEAWLRQPDVVVLHEGFAELPPAEALIARAAQASAANGASPDVISSTRVDGDTELRCAAKSAAGSAANPSWSRSTSG